VDRLVIGVAINRDKGPLFTLEERVAMIESECEAITKTTGMEIVAHPFENLLIHCAHDVGASLIIRGLRAVSDFEYEYQMVGMNRAMDDSIETVFLMAEAEHQAVASRLVKEIARLGGDVSAFAIAITLKDGEVLVQLLPDVAPQHVERMKTLTRDGAYDNVSFHRVIDGFMAQTGDVANANMEKDYNPGRAGTGGSSLPDLPAEFSKLPFDRGVLGAARSQNPNSANSQFFIMFDDGHFLNGQYTVYGRVISG